MKLILVILFTSILLHADTILNCTMHSLDKGNGVVLLSYDQQKHNKFVIKKTWYGKPTGMHEKNGKKIIINTQSKSEWLQSEYMVFESQYVSYFTGDERIATIKISKDNPSKIIFKERSKKNINYKFDRYGECIEE